MQIVGQCQEQTYHFVQTAAHSHRKTCICNKLLLLADKPQSVLAMQGEQLPYYHVAAMSNNGGEKM